MQFGRINIINLNVNIYILDYERRDIMNEWMYRFYNVCVFFFVVFVLKQLLLFCDR